MKKICVIGSINMDLTTVVERFPQAGETITGLSFASFPGGKGANQAVAAARLGGAVTMFGKIGGDSYGEEYLKVFEANSVNHNGVTVEKGSSTGLAVIEVDNSGENKIIIVPGANSLVDIDFINNHYEQLLQYDIFLLQLEIPMEAVLYAVKKLKGANKTIILDPAPAAILPEEIYKYIDYITPNETEIEILTGLRIHNVSDIKSASTLLLSKGANAVIVKAGKDGAYINNREGFTHVPGFTVNAVDTTAAGDSFNGGFAFSLANGNTVVHSVSFANAVGALSTTSLGAQSAMPILEQVKRMQNSMS
jgi:ribokinase